jgi:hypothetical protein
MENLRERESFDDHIIEGSVITTQCISNAGRGILLLKFQPLNLKVADETVDLDVDGRIKNGNDTVECIPRVFFWLVGIQI